MAETQTGWWCEDCQQLTEPIRVYECSTCGETDDERRCTQCNRFKARRDEDGCESCYAEVREVETVIDHDGTVIPADDFDPDGPSRADRAAADRKAAHDKAARRRAARQAAHIAASRATTWGQVRVGDVVLTTEALEDGFGGDILPIVRAITPAAGRLIITLERYSIEFRTVDASDPVNVSTGPSANHHDDKPPFGAFVLEDEPPFASSSPAHGIRVEVGHSTKNSDQPQAPVISFLLDGGNIGYRIAYWHDPAIAATALDVLDQAATRLADHLGEPLDPSRGTAGVEVVEKEWLYEHPVAWVGVRVGADEWQPKHPGLVGFSLNGRHNASFADPHVLAAGVAAARALLPRLVQP